MQEHTFTAKLADWKQKENKWGGATATLKLEIESEDPEREFEPFLGMTSGQIQITVSKADTKSAQEVMLG